MSAALRALDAGDVARAEVVRSFLARYAGQGESARTIRSSLTCVARLFPDLRADAATFPWELLADPAMFDEVQERVVARYGSATAAKHMVAVRGLLQQLARHDLAERASVILTIEGAQAIRGQSTPTPGITTGELGLLLLAVRAHPNRPRGVRDVALFALIAATGCRRAEVCRLTWRDIDWERERLTFSRVKGGRARSVPIHCEALRHLAAWRSEHGGRSGPVFCAVRKNGALVPEQAISAHQVWKLFRSYVDAAGIPGDLTPHSLRVWFVTSLLEQGEDVLTVTRAVGHASPNTTAGYDRRGDDSVRRAIAGLELPESDDERI